MKVFGDLGPVSLRSRKVFALGKESHRKISKLIITYQQEFLSYKTEFSVVNISQFLRTNKSKVALRARKVSGAFETRAPDVN